MIKIHKVLSEPLSILDYDPDYPYEEFFFMEVYGELEEGKVEAFDISHPNLNPLYSIVRHLKSPTLEPYVLDNSGVQVNSEYDKQT